LTISATYFITHPLSYRRDRIALLEERAAVAAVFNKAEKRRSRDVQKEGKKEE